MYVEWRDLSFHISILALHKLILSYSSKQTHTFFDSARIRIASRQNIYLLIVDERIWNIWGDLR